MPVSSRPPSHDKSWARTVVGFNPLDNPVLSFEQIFQRVTLSIAELCQQQRPRFAKTAGLLGDDSIKPEPVRSAIESHARIVIAHLRFESGYFRGRYVRGIGDD